ncbi:uncharacterized protein LOC107477938 [Arachis duranensis]|uniref:Uncharacterized protein LOC107477938 n=1 Tax=Arachis duranensis TaxID=130453 RepID=A0A6P4CLL9_ARADU|nr:uncharacterized protein LOC107477938 [Arachis duranensis]
MIADDSGDDIGASEPAGAGGGSSSVTQQYPPHFSSLDSDAMRQPGDKEDALLSVKTYSIRRGVQYKVVESDYCRYVGKCYEFGNGCTWLIRLSLRQRKGIWEVKRYNGPHTCLASSITSDHRRLDYHVISAFIMPMVRADASVSIKVLLNATASHYGFRTTYRRVWMAKQKAVALIYGDWNESYNELPRWVLGVQVTMPGSIAVLRTSPVRIGGQLDESQAYFHRLFWTFPPCIEVFRHCKPLVSIDGTHLYGKYGGTLLVAIAQDGNSNILPVAFALVEGENADLSTKGERTSRNGLCDRVLEVVSVIQSNCEAPCRLQVGLDTFNKVLTELLSSTQLGLRLSPLAYKKFGQPTIRCFHQGAYRKVPHTLED